MAQELIVHNALYKPDEKRLEIILAMVDFTMLEKISTVLDKESGAQLSKVISDEKRVNAGFGETIYCPDADGHVHAAGACAKAHPDFGKVKAVLLGRISEWRTRAMATDVTPADRKLE
jgi:hypothetical protein